jgi:4-aminobutyrate aminotransferase/(S)-3-amino-2-methylpropionate transaminase
MCALELVRNPKTLEPADTETKDLAHYCYEHGLITITAGTYNNIMRILVPLVITDEQLDEAFGVLEAGLATVAEHKHEALSHA